MNTVKTGSILPVFGAAAVAFALSAPASQVFEVSDVTGLTNAFKQVSADGDEIRLAPGVYDVGDLAMEANSNLSLPKKHVGCVLSGTGAGPGETVIAGKGKDSGSGRGVISPWSSDFTISNLTIAGGCSAVNGGGISEGAALLVDCVISNNYSAKQGGGSYKTSAVRCIYVGNSSDTMGGGGVFDGCYTENCTFMSNSVKAAYNVFGGGLSGGTHTNAEFYGNVAAMCGGAYNATFVGGRFVGNRSTPGSYGPYGSAVGSCTVSGTYFEDNVSTQASGTDKGEIAKSSNFIDCTFGAHAGKDSTFLTCTFDRCKVNGVMNSGSGSRAILSGCTAKNTLFANTSNAAASYGLAAKSSSLYNCTIANHTNRNVNTYSIVTDGTMVNCIITGTYPRDIASGCKVVMTNCIWETQSGDPSASSVGGHWLNGEDIRYANPGKGDYSLQPGSRAINFGWRDPAYLTFLGDKDLAGRRRVNVKDGVGVIDCGAYEYSPSGLMLIFR